MKVKKIFNYTLSLIPIIALLSAGWWFLARGEGRPRLEISHDFFSMCLNAKTRWVRADINLKNIGLIKVDLSENQHTLSKVKPVSKGLLRKLENDESIATEKGHVNWPDLAGFPVDLDGAFLEPTETQTVYLDFIIDESVAIVELTSNFKNSTQGTNGQSPPGIAKALHGLTSFFGISSENKENGNVWWTITSLHTIGEESCAP